jgi:hypothetical protein
MQESSLARGGRRGRARGVRRDAAPWLALLALGIGVGVGCASQLTDVVGGDGDGDEGASYSTGAGGTGGQIAGSGGSGATGSDGGSSTSSGTGATGGVGSTGGSGSGPGGSGAGGAAPCPQGQHFCGGVCAGNTPQTGCFLSDSCAPCVAPANGTSTCAADGNCDFTCGAGWMKSGAQCACATECCSDNDCSGDDTCVGGTCTPPPPTCDLAVCIFECGFSTGCPGICVGPTCTCLTPCS